MVKITNVTGGVYQKNRISNTHVIKASEMIGPKGCVKDCMMYADCNAVNFHKDRFYCELLDDSYSDHEAENKYGVYFTNISEWTKDNDACWPKTCPTKTRCIVAYRNERLCLPFDTPCDNNQCQNGASCINSVRDYSCRCLAGYYGQYCELTPCSSGPCRNAGTCSISGSTYTCTCRHGYYGTQCQFDACSPNPCQNLGTCYPSGGSSYNCACSSGWYGSICNILAFQTRVTMVVYVLHLDPTRITAHANLVIQEQLASKIKTPAMVAVELSVVRTIVNVTSTAYTMGIAVSTKCITVTVANCTCINCIV
ncbi:unnamed protein product [Mytilus edulis]|uniref:EGF-like domain-containing protein n=1 Tax=Mytilus edulis TaxID=6550 RepID=A0A8S3QQ73_MYTED|nr:unnamed protein product [Mytilus edulis]